MQHASHSECNHPAWSNVIRAWWTFTKKQLYIEYNGRLTPNTFWKYWNIQQIIWALGPRPLGPWHLSSLVHAVGGLTPTAWTRLDKMPGAPGSRRPKPQIIRISGVTLILMHWVIPVWYPATVDRPLLQLPTWPTHALSRHVRNHASLDELQCTTARWPLTRDHAFTGAVTGAQPTATDRTTTLVNNKKPGCRWDSRQHSHSRLSSNTN